MYSIRLSWRGESTLNPHLIKMVEYAKEKGEKKDVAEAIFEHYLPRFKGDLLPDTEVGTILSLADKIDTIITSADGYALSPEP